MDERLLALDGRGLSMGAVQLDITSTTSRDLDRMSLGATRGRLDLGGGSLAVREFQAMRAGIAEIRKRNLEAKIAIFHGTKDELIRIGTGREPVSVWSEAFDKSIRRMNS